MKIKALIDAIFIVGAMAAPLGTLFRWKMRLQPAKFRDVIRTGWGGIPYVLGPPLFYAGWPCLILGGVGVLIMWIVTGSPFRVQ